ncbi:MAG: anti-sigma factor [Acidimicrobiia bacterium]|nr:anti-sigma factor [Acidimicrobiia bacterium]MDH5421481.1 anti-sigma factor [Acidimicrobiia bacterium]MDH5503063.1 anti-sigma factor [Acidimicrobiia bacterium]
MEHDEIIGLLGAYALDAVDRRERGLIEAHLDGCTMCCTEVGQFLEVASEFVPATQAPRSLWARILFSVRSHGVAVATRPRPWLGLVAAITVVALSGVVVIQQRRVVDLEATVARQMIEIDGQNRELDQVAPDRLVSAALGDPTSVQAVLSGETGSITFVIEPSGNAFLADSTLPPLPEGLTYQLWAVVDGEIISAAVLGPDPRLTPLRIEGSVAVLALTVEPVGGVVVSDQEPAAVWLADA